MILTQVQYFLGQCILHRLIEFSPSLSVGYVQSFPPNCRYAVAALLSHAHNANISTGKVAEWTNGWDEDWTMGDVRVLGTGYPIGTFRKAHSGVGDEVRVLVVVVNRSRLSVSHVVTASWVVAIWWASISGTFHLILLVVVDIDGYLSVHVSNMYLLLRCRQSSHYAVYANRRIEMPVKYVTHTRSIQQLTQTGR